MLVVKGLINSYRPTGAMYFISRDLVLLAVAESFVSVGADGGAVVGQESGDVDQLLKVSLRLGNPFDTDANPLPFYTYLEVRHPRPQ